MRELIFHALAPPLPAPPPPPSSSAAGSLFISRFNTRRPSVRPDQPNIGSAGRTLLLAPESDDGCSLLSWEGRKQIYTHAYRARTKTFRVEKLGTLIASWRFSCLNNAPAAAAGHLEQMACCSIFYCCRWTFCARRNFYQRPAQFWELAFAAYANLFNLHLFTWRKQLLRLLRTHFF